MGWQNENPLFPNSPRRRGKEGMLHCNQNSNYWLTSPIELLIMEEKGLGRSASVVAVAEVSVVA